LEIKFQSKLYPKLILTEEHYQVLKERLPHIHSFYQEMLKLEMWLYSNPERKPTKNFKRRITNWMINANKFAKAYKQRGQYDEPRVKTREVAQSVGEILNHIANPD